MLCLHMLTWYMAVFRMGTPITRLGLKPETTKEEVHEALKRFGKDDRYVRTPIIRDIS